MLSSRTSFLLFLALIALNSVSFMATNLYVPAMPAMSAGMGVTDGWIQASLTAYMIPFAILPVVMAPLADSMSRRQFILIALFLALIGNLLILSFGIYGLILGRFLQGGAFGMITISARALIADCFKGKTQAKYHSLVQCFSPIFTMASPLLGGFIEHYFQWQGVFLFLLIYCALLWALTFFSLPQGELQPAETAKNKVSLGEYGQLLRHKGFMQYACFPAFMMIGQSGFTSLSTYIFQQNYQLTALEYSLCTLPIYAVLVLSAYANMLLIDRFKTQTVILMGAGCMIFASLLLALAKVMSTHELMLLILGCMIFFIANTLLVTNAYSLACEHTEGRQGCAFAFMSLLKMSTGIVISALAAWLPLDLSSLMVLFLIAGLGSLLMILWSQSDSEVMAEPALATC